MSTRSEIENALNVVSITEAEPEILCEEIRAQLPGILDGISDLLEGKPRTSTNKKKAIQRLVPLLEKEYGIVIPCPEVKRQSETKESTMSTAAPEVKKAKPTPAKKPAAKAKPESASESFELKKITVLVKDSGYPEDSKKAKVFGLLKNGMKVIDFIDACGKLKMDHEEGRNALKRMIKYKKVKVG